MAANSEHYLDDADDLNLYDDLLIEDDEQLRNHQEKKEQQLGDLEKETADQKALILQLQTEMVSVKRENGILRRNISCLYKTAKAEIERKDDLLRELQRRYDGIVFRRTKDARAFLGSNGRNAAKSDDGLVATPPPSSSYVSKKRHVSTETNGSPSKKRFKSDDVKPVRPVTALSVVPDSRETEPPCKVVRELCDDEERILGYTSSALPKNISKKKSSERRNRDNSVRTAGNSFGVLERERSVNVGSTDPKDNENHQKSPNDRSTTTSNLLERTHEEKMLRVKSINVYSSESPVSDSASRRTEVAKSLDRRRNNLPFDKGNHRDERTNDESKSLPREGTFNGLTKSLEIGQPVRSESRGVIHQDSIAMESLEMHSAARSKSSSDYHKSELLNLQLLACGERRTPMLTSSDDGHQSPTQKTKSASHCEGEKLKTNGECQNLAPTSSSDGCQMSKVYSSSRPERYLTKQITPLVAQTKSTRNLKDEMHVERRRYQSSSNSATTNSTETGSIRSNQRPTLIGGRSIDRRDLRVVEERKHRVSKVKSPLKHGSRSSPSVSHCRHTSSSNDRGRASIKIPAEGTRSRADGRKTHQREGSSQRANGDSRDGSGLRKQELYSECTNNRDVSSTPIKRMKTSKRKDSETDHDRRRPSGVSSTKNDLEDGEIASDAEK